jgi:hypothetical protein
MAWLVMATGLAGGAVTASCGSDVTEDPFSATSSTQAGSGASGSAGAAQGGDVAASAGGAGGAATGGAATGGFGQGGSEARCESMGDDCTVCMAGQCTDVYCTCYANAACGNLMACAAECGSGDMGCHQDCLTNNADGISDALLLGDCAATTCDASCSFGTALGPCRTCLFSECKTAMNACFANPECTALIQCFQECSPGDMGCGQNCLAEHADGAVDAEAVRVCRQESCSRPCQN